MKIKQKDLARKMGKKKKPATNENQKKTFEDPFDKIAGKQNSVAPGDWFEEPKNY